MTVKLADGTHAAVHEAALVDYAAMNLARSEGNTLKAVLTLLAMIMGQKRGTISDTKLRELAVQIVDDHDRAWLVFCTGDRWWVEGRYR